MMVQENEVAMLVLGLIVLVVILMYYKDFRRIPFYKLLTIAYFLMVTGFIATVVEGFFWPVTLNYVEHLCNTISSVIVAIWFWKVFVKSKEAL